MQSGAFRSHLPKLAAHGRLDMKRLDEAVRHVLQLKARLGLFQDPFRSLDPRGEWPQGGLAEKHDELARRAARESLVLLKNDGQLLPLKKSGAKIALVGWWENDMDNAEGVGVLWGNKSHTVTLRQGLLDVVGAENLRAVPGSRMDTRIPGGITAAVEAASWADVVVLALGEGVNYTGESRSRWDIGLPSAQQELAEAVALAGKPLVVLLKNGRALQLDGAVKDAASIMVTWFLGKMTGSAIADVLFGDYSPSGRLPVSFPISGGQAPYHYNHRSTGRPCAWPKHFTNCWVDGPSRALYPFGHGLTYSQVIYEDLWLSSDKLDWDGELWIQCTVANAGPRSVQEVVQLYVRDRVASRIRPIRELQCSYQFRFWFRKGFRKLLLEPGKRETVSFSLARSLIDLGVPLAPAVLGEPLAPPGGPLAPAVLGEPLAPVRRVSHWPQQCWVSHWPGAPGAPLAPVLLGEPMAPCCRAVGPSFAGRAIGAGWVCHWPQLCWVSHWPRCWVCRWPQPVLGCATGPSFAG
ncbi:bglX [Symbiodinium sp. CCMP2592]|nr:bglX [Symbiodinium sp. CCMP2592]